MNYLISIVITLVGWAILTSAGDGLTANLEAAGLNTSLAEKVSEPMTISSLFAASLISVIFTYGPIKKQNYILVDSNIGFLS